MGALCALVDNHRLVASVNIDNKVFIVECAIVHEMNAQYEKTLLEFVIYGQSPLSWFKRCNTISKFQFS